MILRQIRVRGQRNGYRITYITDKLLTPFNIRRCHILEGSSSIKFVHHQPRRVRQHRLPQYHGIFLQLYPPSTTTTAIASFTTTTNSDTTTIGTSESIEPPYNSILHYKWIYPSRKKESNKVGDTPTTTTPSPSIAVDDDDDDHYVDNDEEYIFVFLHGLFGQGKNLSTMAQKLLSEIAYPNQYEEDDLQLYKYSENQRGHKCSGILVDLYGHGQSSKIATENAKHNNDNIQDILASTLGATIHHCLVERERNRIQEQQQQQQQEQPSTTSAKVPKLVLVGHSLGGRVALHFIVQAILQACKEQLQQSQQQLQNGTQENQTVSGQQSPQEQVQQQTHLYTQNDDPSSKVTSAELPTASLSDQMIDSSHDEVSTNAPASAFTSINELEEMYVPLHPQHIWLLDTVPNKPDRTVVQVLKAIESIQKQKSLMETYLQQQQQRMKANDDDTDDTNVVEDDESFLSRNDIRQLMMKYNNNIPMGIVEWIASQWLIKEQRFLFDITVIRSIVNDLLIEEKDDDEEIQKKHKKSGKFGLPTRVDVPKRHSKLTFWEQLDVILQQSTNIQIHMIQADRNRAWNYNTVQDPLIGALQRYAKIPHPSYPKLTHHILVESGHWVHVDNLPGLIKIMTSLPLES